MRILGVTASGFFQRGDFELIETHILASAASSVTFSSLATYASTYKHLQLRTVARGTRVANADFSRIRFNDDTTGYARHGLLGNGSSVASFGVLDIIGTQDFPASSAGANQFGATVIDILDPYSTTKNKTVRMLGGVAGTISVIQLTGGLWIDTTAVSSIKLETGNAENYAAGSRFSLYGIR